MSGSFYRGYLPAPKPGMLVFDNFMNVRANQMVLGTFVATFTYGILVLRTVNASVEARFVPGLSVTIAIVISLFGLGVLVTVWPGEKVDETLSRKINAIFIVGPERTLEQDVEFAISQLVEISVRALSPGINDPITAITCIDWLGAILCQLASRKMPSSHRYGGKNKLRIICKLFTFEGMVDAAFNMIRQNSQSVATVSIHLLETIATVAAQARNKQDRAALLRHAALVAHGCKENLSADDDRKDLEK